MKEKSKVYKQAKAERIQHHQISFSTNAKGYSLDRKHRKNNKVNGNRIILINNYLKRQWVECLNQKTKGSWKDTTTRPLYMLSTREHFKTMDTNRMKVKGWKKIFHANRDQKKAGVAILIADKIDFKTKAVKRDKESHYIMIKGSI